MEVSRSRLNGNDCEKETTLYKAAACVYFNTRPGEGLVGQVQGSLDMSWHDVKNATQVQEKFIAFKDRQGEVGKWHSDADHLD